MMTELKSYYRGYNVMNFEEEWDSNTREIIQKRLGPFPKNRFFSSKEALQIATIAKHITYDDRDNIIAWIVYHLDDTLSSDIGEDQRKVGTPPMKKLIRDGLKAIDESSRKAYKRDFLSLEAEEQEKLLEDLSKGQMPSIPAWNNIPQKELFKKLASSIVKAFYSHPEAWSEIGYPGPAYPRGYIRVERGIIDPWEAKINGK